MKQHIFRRVGKVDDTGKTKAGDGSSLKGDRHRTVFVYEVNRNALPAGLIREKEYLWFSMHDRGNMT